MLPGYLHGCQSLLVDVSIVGLQSPYSTVCERLQHQQHWRFRQRLSHIQAHLQESHLPVAPGSSGGVCRQGALQARGHSATWDRRRCTTTASTSGRHVCADTGAHIGTGQGKST